jgi:hypothetical protein
MFFAQWSSSMVTETEVLVLMVFLALKGCCSTEMEQVTGSDPQIAVS